MGIILYLTHVNVLAGAVAVQFITRNLKDFKWSGLLYSFTDQDFREAERQCPVSEVTEIPSAI